jgi:hypothetical protein
MIELKSFDLRVQGSETASYSVEAVGPAGERATAPFAWASVASLDADLQALKAGAGDQTVLERVGAGLFQALFPMDVMMVYVRIKAQLKAGEGLRLRLHLPPELAPLPWELLYYPPDYLTLDPTSPVVRFLDLPDTPRPLVTRPPLLLLHLIANPQDRPELEVEREASQLRSALAGLTGQLDIIRAQPGTLAALRDGLREGCQVLHFTGHGYFSRDQGHLLFEDEAGLSRLVSSDTLAQLLRGTNVRLAVLNACESAMAYEGNAFGSVATALVRAGLPAVIAHQYLLPDNSAIPFAAEFYGALADDYPVDAAASEGRKAILSELGAAWRDSVDWATPVLFMRAPDGRILTMHKETGTGAADQPAVPSIHIESISGGTFTFDQRVSAGPVSILPRDPASPMVATDPLPGLLDQLRQTVRDHAPQEKRARAVEEVAALTGAAEGRPDPALLDSVWQWFKAEVPALSGAVLSVILAFEPRAEQAGDEVLLEFRRRFQD